MWKSKTIDRMNWKLPEQIGDWRRSMQRERLRWKSAYGRRRKEAIVGQSIFIWFRVLQNGEEVTYDFCFYLLSVSRCGHEQGEIKNTQTVHFTKKAHGLHWNFIKLYVFFLFLSYEDETVQLLQTEFILISLFVEHRWKIFISYSAWVILKHTWLAIF